MPGDDLSAARNLIDFVPSSRDYPVRGFSNQIFRGLVIQVAASSDKPFSNLPSRQLVSKDFQGLGDCFKYLQALEAASSAPQVPRFYLTRRASRAPNAGMLILVPS